MKSKCKYCGKEFSDRHNRLNHEKKHEGKRYKCRHCEKTFSSLSGRRYHEISTHEGRKYTCDICEKSYTQKNILQRHVKINHERKRETCPICGVDMQKYWLSTHIEQQHPDVFGYIRHPENYPQYDFDVEEIKRSINYNKRVEILQERE